MENKWIHKQLPKVGQDVIIALDDDTIMMGRFVNDTITRGHHWEAYWQEGLGSVVNSNRHVTHWMPLPESPKP
jgi:hypothetical protein